MRNVVSLALVILSFASCALAQSTQPQFLLLRLDGKMTLLAPPRQSSFEVSDPTPLFDWEGHNSRAVFKTEAQGVSVEFKLDILGPDWLYLSLTENQQGLVLSLRRTNSDGSDDTPLDSRRYTDYASLLNDSDYSQYTVCLLRRFGQNPVLPEIKCLRTAFFGLQPPANAKLERECAGLIAQLDDDQWQIREKAMQRLKEPRLVQHALALARTLTLSCEQHARLEGIAAPYRLEVPEDLQHQLQSLALSEDDIALLSDQPIDPD